MQDTTFPPMLATAKDAKMRAFMVILKRALLMIVSGIDEYLQTTAI